MAKFIQLFRNQLTNVFADKAAAKTALEREISSEILKDGMPIIARYYTGGEDNEIKTLLGIAHGNGANVKVTVFDSGSIDELDATISASTNGVDITIVETDGKLTSVTLTDIDKATLFDYVAQESGDVSAITSSDTIAKAFSKLQYAINKKQDEFDSDIAAGDDKYFTGIEIKDGKLVSAGTSGGKTTVANVDNAKLVDYTAQAGGFIASGDTIHGAFKNVEDKILDMDATTVSGENDVVIDVIQTDGKITATTAGIASIKLSGYTEAAATGDVASTDTLGEALGKLQKTIHEMDLAVVSGDGEVITAVSEADGVVSASTTAVKDIKLTGYVKDTGATGDIAATDDIEAALSKLENKAAAVTISNNDGSINVTTGASGTDINVNIKSGEKVLAKDGNAGLYTDIKLKKETGSTLPADIKERYTLVGANDAQLGTITIDVPKDSHIVSITYITDSSDPNYQNLEYKYIDVSGNTKTEYVDMSELVLETEFASGVTVTGGVAHGVVDSTSEKDSNNDSFLTVGADGFKVDGIKGEIDAKINALDATGGTQTIATGKHVAVEVVETDGKITAVTVVEDKIADADDLTEISNRLGTGVTTANTATAQLAALSGNTASTSGETSVEGAKRYADAKLSEVVEGLDATVTGATSGSHVTISIEELDGKLVQSGLTIEENDIASNTDLGNLSAKTVTEIGSSNNSITVSTAATTANDGTVKYDVITDGSKIHLDNYEKATGSSAVTTADTVNDAIGKLEYKVDAASTDLQTEVDNIETAVGLDSDGTHLTSAGHYTSGASTIEGEIVALDTQLSAVSNTYISDIVESSGITVTTGASAASGETATVSLKLSTTAQTGTVTDMLVFNSDNGLAMSDTWDCGFYSSPANP